MLCSVEGGADLPQDDSSGLEILKQNFSLMSPETKINLKDYLQNLVAMQKVTGVSAVVDNAYSLLREEKQLK